MTPVDWVTLVVAIYGAVVATGSVVVALAANRAAEPRLVVTAKLWNLQPSYYGDLVVTVTNSGRADITIDHVLVVSERKDSPFPLLRGKVLGVEAKQAPPLHLSGKSSESIEWLDFFNMMFGNLEGTGTALRTAGELRSARVRPGQFFGVVVQAAGKNYSAELRIDPSAFITSTFNPQDAAGAGET